MPQADAPRKRHAWLIAPYILAVIAGLLWSGWWVYGRSQLEKTLEAQIGSTHGPALTWKSRSISGYPFRYDVILNGFTATEPGGYVLATDTLALEAAAYEPTHWVGVAKAPVHITGPGRDLTLTGDVLRFSISHPNQTPPKIAIEGVKVKIAGNSPFAAMDRFELHLAAKDGNSASFFVRIDHATAQPDSLLARIGPNNSIIVGLDGDIVNAATLKGAGLKGALTAWAQGAGAFNIHQGGLQAGDALLSLRPSTLCPSADGRVNGELALSLTKASDAVLAMGAVGALPPQTAAVASGVASAGSLLRGPGKPLNVTFKFRGGETYLEGIPLGPSPKLF